MGLLDDAVPGGNIAKPVMVALGALLVGKMMGGLGGQGATAPQGQMPPQQMPPQQGGAGGLGALMGGGGLMGGLGGLLQSLASAGHGEVANSWVGSGPNAPIQPTQLGSALGQTTVSDLARQSGMSEQELLAQLSRVLPGVVDRLTPGGQVPSQEQISSAWGR